MKTKAIPRSRAKTAWGLLQDVKRTLLAEPRRADQGTYVSHVDPRDKSAPACGTIGCIAGWISLMRSGPEDSGAEDFALNLLGYDMNYDVPTGHGYTDHVFSGGGPDIKGEPGTKLHARSIVKRIDRFMKINEKALKARHIH